MEKYSKHEFDIDYVSEEEDEEEFDERNRRKEFFNERPFIHTEEDIEKIEMATKILIEGYKRVQQGNKNVTLDEIMKALNIRQDKPKKPERASKVEIEGDSLVDEEAEAIRIALGEEPEYDEVEAIEEPTIDETSVQAKTQEAKSSIHGNTYETDEIHSESGLKVPGFKETVEVSKFALIYRLLIKEEIKREENKSLKK